MTILDTIESAQSLAADICENATEIADHLADAEIATEEREPDTRRQEVEASIELLDEIESNLKILRTALVRLSK